MSRIQNLATTALLLEARPSAPPLPPPVSAEHMNWERRLPVTLKLREYDDTAKALLSQFGARVERLALGAGARILAASGLGFNEYASRRMRQIARWFSKTSKERPLGDWWMEHELLAMMEALEREGNAVAWAGDATAIDVMRSPLGIIALRLSQTEPRYFYGPEAKKRKAASRALRRRLYRKINSLGRKSPRELH